MTFFLTPFIPLCCSCYCFEARACCVAPVGLEPVILLPQPDEYQDTRHEPLCLVLMQHFKRMCFLIGKIAIANWKCVKGLHTGEAIYLQVLIDSGIQFQIIFSDSKKFTIFFFCLSGSVL